MPYRVDEGLVNTLKKVAAVLKQAEIPFALGGSFAVYAHGGHSSDHDVDFLLREQDRERAIAELSAVGFVAEQPPEDWLVKVYDGELMVDLIHRPVETPVTDATLADSVLRPVEAITMPVVSATQLMVHKLLSFTQHYCDFAHGLPVARSLREQIDWDRVRQDTAHSPYAEAFLMLLDRLGVVTQPTDDIDSAQIQRLLAENGRVAEQGITARRHGHTLVLGGEVESAHRRDEICRQVAAHFPDVQLSCDIGIVRVHAPSEAEEIS